MPTVRVFISSTFRDMQEERDLLVKRVFPELRRKFRLRHIEIIDIDLRWGVTEDQAQRGEILPICLEEIRQCRPYFIGLLGERYGWVPDHIDDDLVQLHPWLALQRGASITQLEIVHGVLNNLEMADKATFYFRDPAYIKHLPVEQRPDFRPENKSSAIALRNLKQRIVTSGLPVRRYSDPTTLADLVLEDLQNVIDTAFPLAESLSDLARENEEHEAFSRSRRVGYIADPVHFAKLDSHVAEDRIPLVIVGESGSGKSALLANWAEHHRAERPSEPLFLHHAGGTPASTDPAALTQRLLCTLAAWDRVSNEMPNDLGELAIALPARLSEAGAHGPFVIVLDALDQLVEGEFGRLSWLPETMPSGVRLIVSTLPGPALDVLSRRGWSMYRLHPLDLQARVQLVTDFLSNYRKRLTPARTACIIEHPQAGNPLFLRVLLDELRLFGIHERLDEAIARYLSSPDLDALFASVITRLESDFERTSPGLLRRALCLLHVAKRGLSETEIRILLGSPDLPLAGAIWSPLRLAMDNYLVDRNGQLGFFHSYMHRAVRLRYLCDSDSEREFHSLLSTPLIDWKRSRWGESLRTYGMEHGSVHLAELGDHDSLWLLADDEEFLHTQRELTGSRRFSEELLRRAITVAGAVVNRTSQDEARFCRLSIIAAKMGGEARGSVKNAIEILQRASVNEIGRLRPVLDLLSSLPELSAFELGLLALLIEARKQAARTDKPTDPRPARLIAEILERSIGLNSGGFDWSKSLLPSSLLAAACVEILAVLPVTDLGRLLAGGECKTVSHAARSGILPLIEDILRTANKSRIHTSTKSLFDLAEIIASESPNRRQENDLLERLEGRSSDRNALIRLHATAVALGGRLDDAWAIAMKASSPGMQEAAVEEAASALGRQGRAVEALELVEKLQQTLVRAKMFSRLAAALAESGSYESARSALETATASMAMADESDSWDFREASAALVRANCSIGNVTVALMLVDRLSDHPARFRAVRALGLPVCSASTAPDFSQWLMLRAWVMNRSADANWITDLWETGWLEICCPNQDYSSSLEGLVSKTRKGSPGLWPLGDAATRLRHELAIFLTKNGDLLGALTVLRDIDNPQARFESALSVAVAADNCGRDSMTFWKEAEISLESAPAEPWERALAMARFASSMMVAGRTADAAKNWSAVVEACKALPPTDTTKHDGLTYWKFERVAPIAAEAAMSGATDIAIALWHESLDDARFESSSWSNDIIHGSMHESQVNRDNANLWLAFELIRRRPDQARLLVQRIAPDGKDISALLRNTLTSGAPEARKATAQLAQRFFAQLLPKEDWRLVTLARDKRSIIEIMDPKFVMDPKFFELYQDSCAKAVTLARTGRIDEAVREAQDRGADALMRVGLELADAGHLDAALSVWPLWTKAIKRGTDQVSKTVSHYRAAIGDIEGAIALCTTWRSHGSAIARLVRSGDYRQAHQRTNDLLSGGRDDALNRLADASSLFGLSHRELGLLPLLPVRSGWHRPSFKESDRIWALFAIADAWSEVGDPGEARNLFSTALERTLENEDVDEVINSLEICARWAIRCSLADLFGNFLSSITLRREVWARFLRTFWHNQVAADVSGLPWLRRSLSFFPFDIPIGFQGIRHYLAGLAHTGQFEGFDAAIRECPELGLDEATLPHKTN